MQRAPIQSNLNFNKKTILILFSTIIVLGTLIYFIYQEFGDYWAWATVFIILFNLYLIYRIRIRKALSTKIFTEEERYSDDFGTYNVHNAKHNPSETKDETIQLDNKYEECSNCSARLIPGLEYCEECGEVVEL